MKKLTILLTLTALVFLGLGCKSPAQQAAEKAVENATGGKVRIDTQNGGEFTVQTDQGTITSEQKLPANFPKYIPIYSNSKLVTATVVNENAMYVSFETADPLNTVYEFYKTALKDWQKGTEANFGTSALLQFSKGSETVNISFTFEEGTSVFDASGKETTTGAGTNFIINWTK